MVLYITMLNVDSRVINYLINYLVRGVCEVVMDFNVHDYLERYLW